MKRPEARDQESIVSQLPVPESPPYLPIQMHYYKNIVTGAIVEMKSVFTGIQ